MRYSPIPQRSDRGISYSTYENLVRQMRRMLNLRFDPNVFYVQQDPAGMFVSVIPSSGGGEDPSLWAFGVTLGSIDTGGTTTTTTTLVPGPQPQKITIQTGWFMVQGDNSYKIDGLTYDLPLNPILDDECYPTVMFDIATKTASMVLLTAFPTLTADSVQVPLVRLKATGATPTWGFDSPGYILHRGNIQFSTALVFG